MMNFLHQLSQTNTGEQTAQRPLRDHEDEKSMSQPNLTAVISPSSWKAGTRTPDTSAITVNRFAETIFAMYPAVMLDSFNAVRVNIRRTTTNNHSHRHTLILNTKNGHGAASAKPCPYQVVNQSEDIVVPLPPSIDDYLARFGKATRMNIKQHVARAQRVVRSMPLPIASTIGCSIRSGKPSPLHAPSFVS